jgi:4-aminobutyrate aminotransferase
MNLEQRERRAVAAAGKVRFFPLSVVRGEGRYLVLEDGRRILDFSGTWGAASLGYGHPAVVAAVSRAVRDMASASNVSSTNPEAVALAEELLAITPSSGARRVWFGHCGSDANDAIARMITAATGRSRFISFIGAAHGGLTGSLGLSGYSGLQLNTVSATRPGQIYAPFPDPYRPPLRGDVGREALAYLAYLLDTVAPPQQIGGIFVEMIMCDAGDIVPPAGFMRGLAELCRKREVLLICDEVKVGLGRTGTLHSFDAEGVVPDIVSFGKALGGGLPLSAVVGPAEILDHKLGVTVTTTSGNPVSAAAGRAVLNTIQEEDLVANAAVRGNQLIERLRELAQKHPLVGDVRGRGLVVGVELVSEREMKTPATRQCAKVVFRAAQLGLALFYVGHHSNVLEITPPLTITGPEIEEGIDILKRALDDVVNSRVPDDAVDKYVGW